MTQKWKNIFNGSIATVKTSIKTNISNIVLDTTSSEDATKIAEYITDKIFKGVDTLLAPADVVKDCLIDAINGDLSALSDDTIGSAIQNKIKGSLSGLLSDAISGLEKVAFDDGDIGDIVYKSDAGSVIKDIVIDQIDWAARKAAEESQPHINNIINEWGFNNIAKGTNALQEIFNGKTQFKWDEEKKLYYTEEAVFGVATHFSPLTYTETTKYSKEWVSQSSLDGINQTDSGWLSIFLGADINPSTISTDHNKYFITIPVSNDEIILKVEKILASVGVLLTTPENNTYKYGAALICGNAPIATQSQILIKFHSNLEQIGGEGNIDEQYNLIGTQDSSEYIWQRII